MKLQQFAVACAAASLTTELCAQTVPQNSADDQAIVVPPLTVSTDLDVGFTGANTLSGVRIATALKDTPVAYAVITQEFIDAFNIGDLGRPTTRRTRRTLMGVRSRRPA